MNHKKSIFFLILFLLIIPNLQTVGSTRSDNGNIIINSTIAHLGQNNGTLPTENSQVDFIFNTNITVRYQASLIGPNGTDFDMLITNGDGDFVARAISPFYPDETTFTGDGSNYTLRVYPWAGTGNFTLTLSIDNSAYNAEIGENFGQIFPSITNETWYLQTHPNESYEFTLIANADNNNLDLNILNGSGHELGSTDETTYPESLILRGDGSIFTIQILVRSGTGDYVLLIDYAEHPMEVIEISFSSNIEAGDTFEWDITNIQFDQPTDDGLLGDGDSFELKFLENGDDISLRSYNYLGIYDYVEFTHNNDPITPDHPNSSLIYLFVLPEIYYLRDGSQIDIYGGLNLYQNHYWDDRIEGWTIDGNEISYYDGGSDWHTKISYDYSTGILNVYEIVDEQIGHDLTIEHPNQSDENNGLFSFLPQSYYFIVPLILLPILKRRYDHLNR